MHVSRICSDLVKFRSENPPGRTDEVIEYIRVFLTSLGIRSAVSGSRGGMCNLVTDRTGTGLLLCGHVDVVPARIRHSPVQRMTGMSMAVAQRT